MPGNVLLFRALRQSTISAAGLDFRVRNGIGYNTYAIITGGGFLAYLHPIVNKEMTKKLTIFNKIINVI